MHSYALLAALFSSTALAAPAPWWPHHGSHEPHHGPYEQHGSSSKGSSGKAVYFLRVDPAGSTVVAIELGSDGMLMNSTSETSTGGVGLQSLNATGNGLPTVGADPLQGQDAVSVGDDYLFTVNSGSNTAVMFKIDPSNPLDLAMMGTPMPTLGEFAMSIAYSTKYQKACVLNGGAVNGVTCYNVDAMKGLVPDGVGLREFGFSATTPPELGGAKGSGSDVQFNSDSSKLIVTFKGDNMPATLGHTVVFDVSKSGVAATYTDNMVKPINQPFGFALDGQDPSALFISDVTVGGGFTVSLDDDTNMISVVGVANNSALAASCWAVYSYSTNAFYAIAAASPYMAAVSPSAGSLEKLVTYDSSLGGAFDTVVVGDVAYSLTATTNIAVIDLTNGNVLQEFEYGTAEDRPFWTGMAMWPASPLLSGGLGSAAHGGW